MTQVNPRFVLLALVLASLALNGCDPGLDHTPEPDAGMDQGDAGGDAGEEPEPELTEPRGAEASLQIQAVRDVVEEDATVEPPLPVEGVAVTYVRPEVGEDPAGFFVQGEADGPALFIAVDPTSLSPVPEVGDLISFRVTATTVVRQQHRVTGLQDFTLRGSGYDVIDLVQDVSDSTELVSDLSGFESELLVVEATLGGVLETCGTGSVCGTLISAGFPDGDEGLRLRISEELVAPAGLRPGCSLAIGPTPLWRDEATAQVSAWAPEDLEVFSCPDFEVRSAVATGPTTITVSFTSELDPQSVTAAAFTLTGGSAGLTVAVAVVDGDTVTLTTSAQEPDAVYSLHIADTVASVDGATIAADTVVYVEAFRAVAGVVVNEADLNVADGCDLIELRVVASGPMGGVVLRDRTSTPLFTFPAGFFAQKNDLIVVHMGRTVAACHGGAAPADEVDGPDSVAHPSNFPGAFDFWAEHGDVPAMHNVLYLLDAEGTYLDFVAFVATGGTISSPQLNAANAAGQAGQWPLPPAGYYGTNDYRQRAVAYEVPPVTGTAQRTGNSDTNDKEGWGQASPSLGALNDGQTVIP